MEYTKIMLIIFAIQVGFRLASEVLLWFADKTETKWDNRIAKVLSTIAWFLGLILGKFGYGSPKKLK